LNDASTSSLNSAAKQFSFVMILLLLVCFALFQRAPIFSSHHLAWQLQKSLIGVSLTPLLVELGLLSAAGLIIDLFGARLILFLSSLFFIVYDICLLLNVSIMLTHDLFIFVNAFVFIAALKFFYENFSRMYFAIAVGLAFSVIVLVHLGTDLVWLDWSRILIFAGVLGAILAVLIFIYFYFVLKPVQSKAISLADVLNVIKRPQVWLLCMVALGGTLSLALFSMSWGDKLLQQYYGLSLSQANQALEFLLIGWLCGTIVFAYLAGKIAHAKYWIVAAYVIAIVLFLLLSYQPALPYETLILILALFGFLIASGVMSYIMLTNFSTKSSYGFAVSLLIFVSVMTILFIKAMMNFRLPTDLLAVGSVATSTPQLWKTIFWYVPMFLGIGAICAVFIRSLDPVIKSQDDGVSETFWQELPVYWRGEKSLAMSFWWRINFKWFCLCG